MLNKKLSEDLRGQIKVTSRSSYTTFQRVKEIFRNAGLDPFGVPLVANKELSIREPVANHKHQVLGYSLISEHFIDHGALK